MTRQEQAKWLNKFDERPCSNWGVIDAREVEVLGQIRSASARTVSQKEIVFILLGQLRDLVKRGETDKLCTEIFDVLVELSA